MAWQQDIQPERMIDTLIIGPRQGRYYPTKTFTWKYELSFKTFDVPTDKTVEYVTMTVSIGLISKSLNASHCLSKDEAVDILHEKRDWTVSSGDSKRSC